MPRGGQKAVPEGKGPVSQEKPGDNFLNEFQRMLQEFKQDFNNRCDDMKQQRQEHGEMKERLDGCMEGMLHEMQQLRPAVETGANGEKTVERGVGAGVNGGHGDTPFINRVKTPLIELKKSSCFQTT